METAKDNFWKYAITFVGGFIVALLFFKACESNEPELVTIPKQKGEFKEVTNPEPINIPYPVEVIKWKTKYDTIEVEIPNNYDKEYLTLYLQAKDSLERLKMFADAIGVREYNILLEDSLVKTENHFKTRGELLSFKQSYTLKERQVEINPNKPVLSLYFGSEVSNTKEWDKMAVKANIYVQNQRGNMFTLGYDTDSRIYAGYVFKVFEIKKP